MGGRPKTYRVVFGSSAAAEFGSWPDVSSSVVVHDQGGPERLWRVQAHFSSCGEASPASRNAGGRPNTYRVVFASSGAAKFGRWAGSDSSVAVHDQGGLERLWRVQARFSSCREASPANGNVGGRPNIYRVVFASSV